MTENSSKPTSGRLWPFTDMEERMMARAIFGAKCFMSRYGKGDNVQDIDKSHYITNGENEDTTGEATAAARQPRKETRSAYARALRAVTGSKPRASRNK